MLKYIILDENMKEKTFVLQYKNKISKRINCANL